MIVAAPALIETYSVLTRLPAPHRLSPAAALSVVEANFLGRVTIVALDEERVRRSSTERSRGRSLGRADLRCRDCGVRPERKGPDTAYVP